MCAILIETQTAGLGFTRSFLQDGKTNRMNYERALAIWEKALGPEHPDAAQSLHNLAGLYQAQGR
jgi:hypothetical protein